MQSCSSIRKAMWTPVRGRECPRGREGALCMQSVYRASTVHTGSGGEPSDGRSWDGHRDGARDGKGPRGAGDRGSGGGI